MSFDNINQTAPAKSNYDAISLDVLQLRKQDAIDLGKYQNDMIAFNKDLHAKGLLTGLDIVGVDHTKQLIALKDGNTVTVSDSDPSLTSTASSSEHQSHSFWSGALNVMKDVGAGVVDEVEHHPVRMLENAAISFGLGAAAVALGPEVCAVTGLIATGYGIYQISKNASSWLHDAKVEYNPNSYTSTQQQEAKGGLMGLGAGITEAGVSIASGALGGIAASQVKAAWFPKTDFAAPATAEAPAATVEPADPVVRSMNPGTSQLLPNANPAFRVEPGDPVMRELDPSLQSGSLGAETEPPSFADQFGQGAKSIADTASNIAQNIPARTSRFTSSLLRNHTGGGHEVDTAPHGFDPTTLIQYLPS